MLDPKILIIKYKAGRLARKLADRSSAISPENQSKIPAIEEMERRYRIKLTESQICAALLMYYGCFAQLATGEGKTFSIGLCAAWLASEGNTVHVVAPNEYLSRRDKEQLEPFYEALNLDVSWIGSEIPENDRFALYAKNIIYTTPSIIAFDQMRERSKSGPLEQHQKITNPTHLIIDEADAILIENGSVPFIFARSIESDVEFWNKTTDWVRKLPEEALEFDLLTESTFLSSLGYEMFEDFLVSEGVLNRRFELYRASNSGLFHKVTMAVRAVCDFSENSDYLISNSKIIVLNQSTGRAEKDRQWGQGLHQAIEAKHHLEISPESEVVSKITVPEIISLYSGFSGTSATIYHAQGEIFERYGRLTIKVDSAHPDNRVFGKDLCFDSKDLKQDVIVEDIKSAIGRGQPVLVGVESVGEAIALNDICVSKGLSPSLLTAKNEDKEAGIIAEAGAPGNLTIATNMAGRGTDIRLGGSSEAQKDLAIQSGGLHVIGASRQSERRLDDQLAGRCGRQGDPGSVQFYVSLGDHLLKNQEKITSVRKITNKGLLLLQKSKANKISVSRDEIDAYNEVFLIHRDIFFSLRNSIALKPPEDVFDELISVFSVNLRKDLLDYGINKQGFYKDFDGFYDKIRSLFGKTSENVKQLNSLYSGEKLCLEIEKSLLRSICEGISLAQMNEIRSESIKLFDDMWQDHQLLLEQIYDHAKWQSLIQKNEKIQFSVFGYEAMVDFIENLESSLIKILFEGIK